MAVIIEKSGVVNNLPKFLVSQVEHNLGILHREVSKFPPAKLLELAKSDYAIILACQDYGIRSGLRHNFIGTISLWYGQDFINREADFPMLLTDQQKNRLDWICSEIYDLLVVLSEDTLQEFRDRFPTVFMLASTFAIKKEFSPLETV